MNSVPHQNAAQIGMAVENDSVEIEDFALLKLRRAPDGRERRKIDLVAPVRGAHANDQGAVFFVIEKRW